MDDVIKIAPMPYNRLRFHGKTTRDTVLLKKVIKSRYFDMKDYDAVLAKVSREGYWLEEQEHPVIRVGGAKEGDIIEIMDWRADPNGLVASGRLYKVIKPDHNGDHMVCRRRFIGSLIKVWKDHNCRVVYDIDGF